MFRRLLLFVCAVAERKVGAHNRELDGGCWGKSRRSQRKQAERAQKKEGEWGRKRSKRRRRSGWPRRRRRPKRSYRRGMGGARRGEGLFRGRTGLQRELHQPGHAASRQVSCRVEGHRGGLGDMFPATWAATVSAQAWSGVRRCRVVLCALSIRGRGRAPPAAGDV